MPMMTDAVVQLKNEKFALLRVRHCMRGDAAVMLLPSDLLPDREAFASLRVGSLVDIDEIRMDDRGPRAMRARVVPETDLRYSVVSCKGCGCCFLVATGFPHPPGWCRACQTRGTPV